MKKAIQNLINKMMSYSEEARPGWDGLLKSELCNYIINICLVVNPTKPTNFEN